MKEWKFFFMLAASFLLGGALTYSFLLPRDNAPAQLRLSDDNFPLINPLLFANNPSPGTSPEIRAINSAIQKGLEKKAPDIKRISVYYRNANTGEWTGSSEFDKFSPASLMKVGILITYLKEAQAQPELLDTLLYYDGVKDENAGLRYGPEKSLTKGSYSVRELLVRMITASGNNATDLLIEHIGTQKIKKTFADLNVQSVSASQLDPDFLSPADYSYIFRALYNATYLRKDTSEIALEMLAQVSFEKGLRIPIPENIPISHKFGEHSVTFSGKNPIHELHDCGIVYYPGHPYFLCVMTEGGSFENLETVIQEISKQVYETVQSLER